MGRPSALALPDIVRRSFDGLSKCLFLLQAPHNSFGMLQICLTMARLSYREGSSYDIFHLADLEAL
jgi:hypothetical protein